MGKNKKAQEKLRPYYRGPLKKPTKVASEQDMQVISEALIECVPSKSKHAFKCLWKGRQTGVKLVIGLASSLRHLRHKRTLALIFDDTASEHLANLLIEYANKLEIPIIKAHRMIELAPKLKLKTLLLLSLIELTDEAAIPYKESDPRPKPVESILEIESFNRLASLLQDVNESCTSQGSDKYSFKPARIDQVKSSGKSRAKKDMRKEAKMLKRAKKNS